MERKTGEKSMITVNFEKAKELTKERLRKEREPLLVNLDIQFQRNLESGLDNKYVIDEKQRLRDLPSLVDNCNTIDELKLLHP